MENTKNRFLDILEQSEARELFDEYDSSLNTVVHTGRVIEAFSLKIDFYDDIVMIVTSSDMGSDDTNTDSVRNLLDSINSIIEVGSFIISNDKRIIHRCGIPIDVISDIDNPFDVIFLGCELFGYFQDSILKALLGQHIVAVG